MDTFTGKSNIMVLKFQHLYDGFVSCKDAAFHFKMLIDRLEWCGL